MSNKLGPDHEHGQVAVAPQPAVIAQANTQLAPLLKALNKREQDYRDALSKADETLEEEREAYWALREAVFLVSCLRRLVPECTQDQIYKAFGAPGDFGYETPIGDALARVYGLRT